MAQKQENAKPWGGRFAQSTDQFVETFTESVSFDQRLWRYDIMGSLAHVGMLAKAGVLTREECDAIQAGLRAIGEEIEGGRLEWRTALEDVHMNIETALVERIGEVGKKLHTGRSRNDQIATDLRLYLRDQITGIAMLLADLMAALLDAAERESASLMPGLTHLQTAQPVTFGHHLMAWYEMLARDGSRLRDCYVRTNVLPLGAAALAGTSYPIDREFSAVQLGFERVSHNSLDAVSDRDFAIEFTACAALIMMHLSRFSEELILWMSQPFGFIDLDDAWCTGSSIMPQKKNPDIPELCRGKSARVYGDLQALLTLMKGQALAYNRDNQEDKESLFDAVDTVRACLTAYTGLVPGIRVNHARMQAAASAGYSTATDLADYLVVRGIPFRDAHAVVGQAVRHAIDQGVDLAELPLKDLKRFSEVIEEDVFDVLSLQGSVAARDHIGGTAPRRVLEAVQAARHHVSQLQQWIEDNKLCKE